MKKTILTAVAFACAAAFAGERQALWPSVEKIPDFQEHQIGAMTPARRDLSPPSIACRISNGSNLPQIPTAHA